MCKLFSCFHNSHNCRIDLVLSFLENSFFCLVGFSIGLVFCLNRIDLYASRLGLKVLLESKHIRFLDFFRGGIHFVQNFRDSTGKRRQSPFQLTFFNIRSNFDFHKSQFVIKIKQIQHHCLIERDL
eukprot:TRINITY_DN5674_c0_g1_i1.p1 TRINITY_DN5674_c0_g1~~TRINITY_DN5674_c0_g1_i1.p1  ORF type:complete len:126 (-),score=7.25 TRINITY_DN5674_c0_g1_i1:89-466(-)